MSLEQPILTGRILDEPEAVYFRRDPGVASNSGLKILDGQSPAHYIHWCNEEEGEAEAAHFAFGHGYHAAVLEPEVFARSYCVLPADAPQRPTAAMLKAPKPSPNSLMRQDWWAQWDADNAGRIALPAKQMDQIRGMADAMRGYVCNFPTSSGGKVKVRIGDMLDFCEKEVTLRWVDPRTGVPCKARVDLDCREFNFGGDLKSCVDASPDGFARAVHSYRYHQQHVHYCDGAQATGEPWDNFWFFASEKEPPYVPGVYRIPAMAEERGRFFRNRGLDTLKRCLQENRWPGYSDDAEELILPAFAYYDANDKGA
jgi:hypothetical protein